MADKQKRDKPQLGVPYRAWSPDATDEQVREAFRARYGVEPQEIHRTGGCVLAGPVPEEGRDGGSERQAG